jgi:hypothetical protein
MFFPGESWVEPDSQDPDLLFLGYHLVGTNLHARRKILAGVSPASRKVNQLIFRWLEFGIILPCPFLALLVRRGKFPAVFLCCAAPGDEISIIYKPEPYYLLPWLLELLQQLGNKE